MNVRVNQGPRVVSVLHLDDRVNVFVLFQQKKACLNHTVVSSWAIRRSRFGFSVFFVAYKESISKEKKKKRKKERSDIENDEHQIWVSSKENEDQDHLFFSIISVFFFFSLKECLTLE